MKKLLTLVLVFALLLCTACSGDAPEVTNPIETTEAPAPVFTDELKAQLDGILAQNKYQGILHLSHNGETVYQFASGSNDVGEPLTVDSPMYICSMSKQFCAAAIVMLRDQGKLSLEDTLEKYFPEYTIGKDITLKNLLTMRSGILRDVNDMINHPENYKDLSTEELEKAFKDFVFSQPLNFEPGTNYEYSNNNYRLLSFVVEMVSGQNYEEFIRENLFEPVGMSHSGFKIDVPEHPEWGLTYDNIIATGDVPILAQGSGGVVTTAEDMDKWMTALQSGKVVSMDSFREMTTDYSPETAEENYGYALMTGFRSGWGHSGNNGSYMSQGYFYEEYKLNFFMVSGSIGIYNMDTPGKVSNAVLRTVLDALEAASG